ncbi:hypothetical protein [Bradyrhizobium sp.]|uniref:hypothetical protein n=1 Tax=Bradyrhizobium sp. TaxID=376 RepID=UPI003BB1D9B1
MTKLALYLLVVGIAMPVVNVSAKDTCTFRLKACVKIMNEQIRTFGKVKGVSPGFNHVSRPAFGLT